MPSGFGRLGGEMCRDAGYVFFFFFFFLWLHARFTLKCVMGYPTEILPNITDMFGDGRSRSACGGTGPIFGM